MMTVMKDKMKRVSNQIKSNSRRPSGQFNEDGEHAIIANDIGTASPMAARASILRRDNSLRRSSTSRNPDSLVGIKWPTRLLSLVHPFNLDEEIDQ